MEPLLPFLKTVLPYLTAIITAALPAFTAKKDETDNHVTANQIAELQAAVKANAESIQVLAAQMQRLVQGIETAALTHQRALRRTKALAVTSFAVSLSALGAVLYVLLNP